MDSNVALSRSLRGIVFLLFTASGIAFLPHLFNALATHLSLGEALKHVLSNPWAASALFDYLAGLTLTLPYFAVIGPAPFGLIICVAVFVLGNPVTMFRLALLVIFSSTTLTASLLPLAEGAGTSPNRKGVVILRTVTVAVLAVYVASVIRAFALQPNPGDGWEYIKNDEWSWLTFLDNLLGVLVAAVYVLVREQCRAVVVVPTLTLLALLGSGVTCVYVLLATVGANSIQEALLVRRPVLAKYLPRNGYAAI
ncbi:hypothetical protein BJ742DRAFT_61484 [Cladochytrium replicatum]|nr:hypothetical protein BJ742DRAFT_61484 [Cladochytrium replicatum]